jgi:hypothetical protein
MHPILASLSYHILVVENELDLYEMIRTASECDRFRDTFAAKKSDGDTVALVSQDRHRSGRCLPAGWSRHRGGAISGVVENTGHIDDRASPAHTRVRRERYRLYREAVPPRTASSRSKRRAGKGRSGIRVAPCRAEAGAERADRSSVLAFVKAWSCASGCGSAGINARRCDVIDLTGTCPNGADCGF